MTLIDFDGANHDLSSPMPRTHDVRPHATVMARGTPSVNYTTPATTEGTTDGQNSSIAGGGRPVKAGFKRLMATIPVTVYSDGSFLATAFVAHNLGYVPMIEAQLENATATVAGGSGTATNVSIPLPTFLDAHEDTILGSALSGGNNVPIFIMKSYIAAFANETFVYVNIYNATGNTYTETVTCYLYQKMGS